MAIQIQVRKSKPKKMLIEVDQALHAKIKDTSKRHGISMVQLINSVLDKGIDELEVEYV